MFILINTYHTYEITYAVYRCFPYKAVCKGVIRQQMVLQNILEFDAPSHRFAVLISSCEYLAFVFHYTNMLILYNSVYINLHLYSVSQYGL